MSSFFDNSSFVSREQVAEAYLKVIQLIDERVTPLLGKATTRVLVQGAAKRVMGNYRGALGLPRFHTLRAALGAHGWEGRICICATI